MIIKKGVKGERGEFRKLKKVGQKISKNKGVEIVEWTID